MLAAGRAAASIKPTRAAVAPERAKMLAGLLVLLAIAMVALPALYGFATVFWTRPDDTHEPLLLIGTLYGFWRLRPHMNWQSAFAMRVAAVPVAVAGLLAFVVGHSQEFYQLEGLGVAAFTWAGASVVADRVAWPRVSFLCLMLLFVIPIPATLADALLVPMKMALTHAIVEFFSILGYPVANHGILLSVGFYQLEIADACAGLRSMLALSAIGLMFIYFVPARRLTNVGLILLLPVIALFSNFCRVAVLVLITYYGGVDYGEAAHNIAGYSEVGLTLALFVGAHRLFEALGDRWGLTHG